MNLCQGFLNIHVGKRENGDDAIKALILEGQALARTMQIGPVWKSFLGSSQAAVVYVKSYNFIRVGNSPWSQVSP